MSDRFNVTCYLCNGSDDIRKMGRIDGKYYHKVKIKGFDKTCIQAVRDNLKRRD